MASFPTSTETMGPGIRQLAEQGRALNAMDYFGFRSATNAASRNVACRLQTRFDFLLTPTLGMLPMAIEKCRRFSAMNGLATIQFVLPVSFARCLRYRFGRPARWPARRVQLVGQFGRE